MELFVKMQNRSFTIGLVAGEASGDILAAGLIRALKAQLPNVSFFGVAGPLMQAEGCEVWYEMEKLSVMGILEVLHHLPRLIHIRRDLTRRFMMLRPDIFIGIDAPDFNIRLEKKLKQKGIRTLHYVSPSVWAWRQNRLFSLAQATDMVLALFPFEKQFYDRFNIPCYFVGHMMADEIPLIPDKSAARMALGIDQNSLCLALLPGSRQAELALLGADFIRTAMLLHQQLPHLKVLVPLSNNQRRKQFERIQAKIAPHFSMHLFNGQARLVLEASNAALLASGTVTLESMLAKCPMVVSYRLKYLTYWIAKLLVKTPYFSLPNLLAGERLVPELLQKNCDPQKLSNKLLPLLKGGKNVQMLKERFLVLHQSLRCGANQKAAQAVLALIK